MDRFFNRFRKLKSVETQGLRVAAPLPVTAVLTHEQVLFYSARDAEQAQRWKELHRPFEQAKRELAGLQKLINEAYEIAENSVDEMIERSADSRMLRPRQELISEALNSEPTIGYERRYEKILREYKEPPMQALSKALKQIPLAVSIKSPLPRLWLYGVLNYTQEPTHYTGDPNQASACFRYLADMLIDDIENSPVEKIILLAGWHETAFHVAAWIAHTCDFPPGIVEVYWPAGISIPYVDSRVSVLRKEREHCCDFLWKMGMPAEIVKIALTPDATVGNLLKRLAGDATSH
jgi:hypothetical protein